MTGRCCSPIKLTARGIQIDFIKLTARGIQIDFIKLTARGIQIDFISTDNVFFLQCQKFQNNYKILLKIPEKKRRSNRFQLCSYTINVSYTHIRYLKDLLDK